VAVEPIERARAKAREQAGRPPGGKFPQGAIGKTRDKIGAFAGVSGRTVEKIAHVMQAAEAEPEKFGPLVPELDRYRGVDRAYRAAFQARATPPRRLCCWQVHHVRRGGSPE